MKEMRVVMVGKTGVGKSSVGNSLLKEKHFFNSTLTCKYGSIKLEDGTNLVIVDTPGIFDTSKSNMDTSDKVDVCIRLSSPGPHAFFFVLKIGAPFTAEEMDTIQSLKDIFGTEVMRYVIVVFTGKDNLEEEEMTLNEYIGNAPPELNELIAECNGRFVAINNRAKPDERERDIQEIFQVVRKTMTENGGKHYTGEMYEAAEEFFKEKLLEKEKKKEARKLDQTAKELEEKNLNMKKKLDEEIAALEEEQRQRDLLSKKREEELAWEMKHLNNLRLVEEKEHRRCEEKMKKLLEENEEERRKIQEERKQEVKEREMRFEKEKEEMRQQLEKEQTKMKKKMKEIEEESEAERKRIEEEREWLKEEIRDRLRMEVQDDDSFLALDGKAMATVVKEGWKSFVSWFK